MITLTVILISLTPASIYYQRCRCGFGSRTSTNISISATASIVHVTEDVHESIWCIYGELKAFLAKATQRPLMLIRQAYIVLACASTRLLCDSGQAPELYRK